MKTKRDGRVSGDFTGVVYDQLHTNTITQVHKDKHTRNVNQKDGGWYS